MTADAGMREGRTVGLGWWVGGWIGGPERVSYYLSGRTGSWLTKPADKHLSC